MNTVVDTFNKDDNDCRYINNGICLLKIRTLPIKNNKCIGAIYCNSYTRKTKIIGL